MLPDILSELRAQWELGRLDWVCMKRRIPLAHVAHQLRVSHATVGAWAYNAIPDDRLQAVADVVGVSARWLGSGEISPVAMAAAEEMAAKLRDAKPCEIDVDVLDAILSGWVEPVTIRAWNDR